MAITRGFIRAYAKLLKVDAAPLLATLGGETMLVQESIAPRKSLATPFSETRLPSLMEKQALSSKWVIGLLVIMLLGVAIWALREGSGFGELSLPALQSKDTAEPVANTEASAAQAPEKVDEQSATSAPVSAESNAIVEPAAAPNVAPVPAERVPEPSASGSSTEAKDGLILKVRQDSWLEIKRVSNGSMIVARLAKAGETEILDVTEPVSVVIGNAAGVDASLRGEAIDLKSSAASSGNVARLNLK
jgi:cytoskeleton protein RodZ